MSARMSTKRHRIALVLGAGGSSGGAWIKGCLDALEARTGFRPGQAEILIGTSIGAIAAARIEAEAPASTAVFDTVAQLATVPKAPSTLNTARAAARLTGGKGLALAARAGAADALTWVERIEPSSRAQVVSMQRFPPERRVARLSASPDPLREVAASAAIPFGASPVELDDRSHIDGAVWSVSNADLVSPADAELLIVIAPLVAADGGTLVSSLGRDQLATELAPWHHAEQPALVLVPTGDEYAQRRDRKQHNADGARLVHRLADQAQINA